jgi:hypothetical protein
MAPNGRQLQALESTLTCEQQLTARPHLGAYFDDAPYPVLS